MTHACGTCTLCCELVSVSEIGKPSFARCQHQRDIFSATPGCAIYAQRPYSCRAWSCLWLKDASWPDELKPDRCGFVVDEMVDIVKIDGNEHPCAQIWVAKGHEESWRDPVAYSVIAALIEKKLAVLWRIPSGLARAFCRESQGGISYSELISATSEMGSDAERLVRASELAKGLQLGD